MSVRCSVRLAVACAAILCLSPAAAHSSVGELPTVDLGGIEARSAALLLSGQETGDLEASFLAQLIATPEEGTSILVVADLAGASLLEGTTEPRPVIEVYAYALDAAGALRATLTRAFRLDLATHRAALESGGVKFLARLDLPGGAIASSLRLLVLHRASGRLALRTLPLASPELPTEPPVEAAASIAPLLVLEDSARWLVARIATEELPLALADDSLLPATHLVATGGGLLSLRLAIGSGQPQPMARLLDSSGGLLADLQTAGSPARAADPPALDTVLDVPLDTALDVVLDLVLDLAAWGPESYLLEFAAGNEPGRVLRLPIDLVGEQLADGAIWFDRPPPPEADPVVAPASRPTRRGRSALQRMALSAYKRTLDVWQRDDLEAAAAELSRFEAGAITMADEGGEGIEVAQSRASAELAQLNIESLVPLMCLHERLFRYYYGRESYLLATHSRRMALGMAQLYAERGGDRANRTAALVLVSLAGLRQEMGARLDAFAAFESALDMDSRQPEALLGLAVLHESLSHYETTVDLLRRLDRTGPMSPAAKIRLAINLGRVGSAKQAITLLEGLVDAQAEWISKLAYQERARLLIRGQRADEALATLVAARERYPDDQGLTLQQAALLDKLGKPLAGQRVLAQVDALAGDRGESPRLRYSAMPTAEIEAARRRLARAAAERLAGVMESAGALQDADAP